MSRPEGHVLVVDDSRVNRLTLARSLEQSGYRVSLAEDGEQALQLLRQNDFDVVLLDIVMPGMDGYEVLRRIKGNPELRRLPVIVISALDEIESAVRCIEMGAEDYLPKPFNAVLLRARLNASLQRKRLRDMEKAYLDQELMLRQSERLATLGRLSAGMAHELNNPAAAAHRCTSQLKDVFRELERCFLTLQEMGVDPAAMATLRTLAAQAPAKAEASQAADPLSQSDRAADLEQRFAEAGVPAAWEPAGALVDAGYQPQELSTLVTLASGSALDAMVRWLAGVADGDRLLREIHDGTDRIVEIVQALKGYSYMDQAPVQDVDVHAGLETTLVMLAGRLGRSITLKRAFAADVPTIEAFGSELNQVWTNLMDNAIDAMQGRGELTLRTRFDEDWVIVSVEDSGPGIAPEMLPHIFDPFFTTKPPGQGTGLGLNVSHGIVVQRHGGRIDVDSRPGHTCFDVFLPRHRAPDPGTSPVSSDLGV